MVKLIVFDLDGTRGSMGLEPLATERIVRFVGNGVANLVRRAIADSDVDFEEALRRMKRYYAGHLVETTALYPGVSRGLAELREAGIQLAVLSNKPTDASRRILDCLGVGGCFADIIGGDTDFPLKPRDGPAATARSPVTGSESRARKSLSSKSGRSRNSSWQSRDFER